MKLDFLEVSSTRAHFESSFGQALPSYDGVCSALPTLWLDFMPGREEGMKTGKDWAEGAR